MSSIAGLGEIVDVQEVNPTAPPVEVADSNPEPNKETTPGSNNEEAIIQGYLKREWGFEGKPEEFKQRYEGVDPDDYKRTKEHLQMVESPLYDQYRRVDRLLGDNVIASPVEVLKEAFILRTTKEFPDVPAKALEELWEEELANNSYDNLSLTKPDADAGAQEFKDYIKAQNLVKAAKEELAAFKNELKSKVGDGSGKNQNGGVDLKVVQEAWAKNESEVVQHLGSNGTQIQFEVKGEDKPILLNYKVGEAAQAAKFADPYSALNERWNWPEGELVPKNPAKLADDMYILQNFQQILADAYEQGKASAIDGLASRQRNQGPIDNRFAGAPNGNNSGGKFFPNLGTLVD